MARIRLARNIQSVKLLIGRIVATTPSGKQHSYRYEVLTPKQEAKLRSMAAPAARRREVKPTRESGKSKKSINYAEKALGQPVFVTTNGRTSVIEVQHV